MRKSNIIDSFAFNIISKKLSTLVFRLSLIILIAGGLFLVQSGANAYAQDNFADSDQGNIPEAVAPPENTIENVIIVGNLTFFDNEGEALFNNGCPFLAVEDFEDTNVGPNDALACPSPFNSLTNNGCYSPGALIPGFSLSVGTGSLAVFTPPFNGVTNVTAGASSSFLDTEIAFTEAVNAVGMVLVTFFSNTPADVQVFGVGNVFLGSTTVNLTPTNGTFLGVISERPITRIELTGFAEEFYELSFGECDFARPIPTLSEWGLIAMAGILGIVGFMVMRRRKATA